MKMLALLIAATCEAFAFECKLPKGYAFVDKDAARSVVVREKDDVWTPYQTALATVGGEHPMYFWLAMAGEPASHVVTFFDKKSAEKYVCESFRKHRAWTKDRIGVKGAK